MSLGEKMSPGEASASTLAPSAPSSAASARLAASCAEDPLLALAAAYGATVEVALQALEPQLKREHRLLMKWLGMQREAAEREAQEKRDERRHARHMAGLAVGAVIAVAMLGAGVYVARDAWWLATLLCGPSLLALAKIFVLRRSDPDDMRFVSKTARSSTAAAEQAQQPPP